MPSTCQTARTLRADSKLAPKGLFTLHRIQSQKACGVVVKDVAFLLWRQVVRVLDDADGIRHQLRPEKLVCSEHDAVFEAAFHQALNVLIHFFDGVAPDQAGDVNINVRVRLEESQHLFDHRVASVHHPSCCDSRSSREGDEQQFLTQFDDAQSNPSSASASWTIGSGDGAWEGGPTRRANAEAAFER